MGTIKLNILYEDNHLIAAVKPPGILSQADHTGADDMLTLLKAYIKEKYNKPGDVFLGLVHRLDRPTGGVMVFARTSKAANRLYKSIQSGDFNKTYHCVVCGRLPKSFDTLTDYLLKDEKKVMSSVTSEHSVGAKKAILSYECLTEKNGLSLVSVKLMTGRHHQIRVQLSHIGCPIYGDRKYGHYKGKDDLALWAHTLSFPHPTKKETITLSAPPNNIYPFTLF